MLARRWWSRAALELSASLRNTLIPKLSSRLPTWLASSMSARASNRFVSFSIRSVKRSSTLLLAITRTCERSESACEPVSATAPRPVPCFLARALTVSSSGLPPPGSPALSKICLFICSASMSTDDRRPTLFSPSALSARFSPELALSSCLPTLRASRILVTWNSQPERMCSMQSLSSFERSTSSSVRVIEAVPCTLGGMRPAFSWVSMSLARCWMPVLTDWISRFAFSARRMV
mmetsp:Transcript_11289/g.23639  ORF Transcript_11289/g.23639 Transcript_11289/m.23639 type:complete len:234 (-) Transcript_11289:766-1467(-)